MENKILIPVNNNETSKAVLNYLKNLNICTEGLEITFLHVLRMPSSGQELMGKRFMDKEPDKVNLLIEEAKEELVESGVNPDNIKSEILMGSFPTIADGIIEFFNKNHHTMVILGRKKLSKAEEFVLGDVSIKLVRDLEDTAVVVVKIK